ncbi:DUF6585 family protein [Kitasatospora sp. NPDC001539]|uniref:DUF6585 family protein n=1 Tax=Kitasatospora sp. NPDC001539 TaxID=3154384 RepID=UPI003326EE14
MTFNSRLFGTEAEAKEHLQEHLDARAGGDGGIKVAAERLQTVYSFSLYAHTHAPDGRGWHVLAADKELCRLVVDRSGVVRRVRFRRPGWSAFASESADVPPEVARIAGERRLGRHCKTLAVPLVAVPGQQVSGNRVYEFEYGLVRHDQGAAPLALRWDETTELFRDVTVTRHPQLKRESMSFSYTLIGSNGTKIPIIGSYDEHAEGADSPARQYALLGRRAEEQVTRALISSARAALDDGQSLTFGKFTISEAGIRGKRGLIPWSEATVSTTGGRVTVSRTGKLFSAASEKVADIPNVSLLLTIVDAYRAEANDGVAGSQKLSQNRNS